MAREAARRGRHTRRRGLLARLLPHGDVGAAEGLDGLDRIGGPRVDDVVGAHDELGAALALARALIRNPKILMLDEPTTGLDPTRTGSIHALVRHSQQRFGLTVVMVSHDVPAVFEISDRVAFMHEGRMKLTGTPAEVAAANDEVFNRFLAGRASGDERDAAAL